MKRDIPDVPPEDLKVINDSFKTSEAVSIKKDRHGNVISYEKEIVNEGFSVNDFRGKTLKHDKSLIPKGGVQVTIARKGQRYDDIPLADRQKVMWSASDFV